MPRRPPDGGSGAWVEALPDGRVRRAARPGEDPGGWDVLLASSAGAGARFAAADAPAGRAVIGIRLPPGASLAAAALLRAGAGEEILCVSSDGRARRVPGALFPAQLRGGRGRLLMRLAPGARLVAALAALPGDVAVAATSSGALARFRVGGVLEPPLTAAGSPAVALAEGEEVEAAWLEAGEGEAGGI